MVINSYGIYPPISCVTLLGSVIARETADNSPSPRPEKFAIIEIGAAKR